MILLPNKEVPKEAWYAPRSRYKADKLIRILKNAKPDSVNYIMGITPKVALHEIGHNLGLPHCTTNNCFMHAAEGSIKQIDAEKRDMCSTCRKLAQLQ